MVKEKFLKLKTEDKVNHILSLADYKEQQDLLNFLKTKDKFEHIKVSGKVKTMKSNPKSNSPREEVQNNTGELYIDLKYISDNPFQPRLQIEQSKLAELAKSIKERGLLQPIVLNKSSDNIYEIIAGHTRKDAVKLNGETKIKAIIFSSYSKTDSEYKNTMLSNAIVENIHRNDLDPIETAISFKNALTEGIYKNQAQLATSIGKQKIYVTKILSILKLQDNILEDLRVNKSTKDIQALYFLQRIPDLEIQKNMYFSLISQKINREDIIEYVKNLNNKNLKKVDTNGFTFKKDKIEIKNDFSNLTEESKKELTKDIEKLIKKYLD
ncbi:ParB/RepB/Spo0J family partition protein [Poseidonibacter sp.]|uniref:ParB/RepB/Spo0J family partition protein n=1 Tax=Poseidonibacter sp. TaxID=2321188 RepID=UPI003C756F7B